MSSTSLRAFSTVPGQARQGRQDCLITRLQAARWDALTRPPPGLRHQSGVIIFARTKQAQGFLGQEFEQRRAQKTYVARVHGRVDRRPAAPIDLPIGSDWDYRPRQKVDQENGRPGPDRLEGDRPASETETRLRLSPHTGRSHQLRVHMLALGHPILGDQIYAPETSRQYPRLMLHAETLARFIIPTTGEWVTFTAPEPF